MKSDKIVKSFKESETDKQLICFPYVGGASNFIVETANNLKSDIEILSIDPPGHGSDILGVPLKSIEEMANLYYDKLKDLFKSKIYLFGYSLGAYVAYQIADLILKKNSEIKISIIIAASNAPHIIPTFQKKSDLSDDDFFKYLKSIGGIPEKLEKKVNLIPLFMEVFRSDFKSAENFKSLDYNLDIPSCLIYGDKDIFATPETIIGWQQYFTGEMVKYKINGEHMFIKNMPEELANILDDYLKTN